MSDTNVFDRTWMEERARLAGAEALWDPGSCRLIKAVGIARGARVLEVGAGGGAIVDWMADVVGPEGGVVATDVDPRFLAAIRRANVEVIRSDVVADPVPGDGYDLVHSRLVLEHLPARAEVLDKLVGALRPGGVLLVEDYDWGGHDVYPPSRLLRRVIDAVGAMMESRGYDRHFGRTLVGEMRRRLSDVESDGRLAVVDARGPGASAFRLSLEQFGPALVDASELTAAELEAARAELDHPDRVVVTPALIAAWGRAA